MILKNFLVGLPAMLVCLAIQALVAFWCVRHYVRHSAQTPAGSGFWTGIRPLIVAMLAMMICNMLQIGL